MKIGTWTVAGASACAFGLALTAPALFGACSSSSVPPAAAVGGGGACSTEAGAYPPPNCDDTDESCSAPSPACVVTPCDMSSPCLAMADNTGKPTDDLRLRKLNVTAPSALAQHFIQAGVIDDGVNLDNTCGEPGTGSFSWLARFDTTNNKLTTGGAPPADDPFNTGYCFVNQTIGGLPVAPVVVNMTQGSDGRWSSDVIPKLYVPIYINGDPNNVVVLPLTQSKVTGVLLSADGETAGGAGNCIGQYNPNGVGAPTTGGLCADQDPSSCERWLTNGALGGYITLKEANAVNVVTLGKSLCVLLTGGTSTDTGGTLCATNPDGSITAQGDFCSTTDSPGGCADSYWLAASFAASAALINDGSSVPACNGSMTGGGDAGTD
ncbi:MAG TPA: hypothetical protein VGL81_35870 [Polyangiaceae bacterium]|jgi:hypothetical protein